MNFELSNGTVFSIASIASIAFLSMLVCSKGNWLSKTKLKSKFGHVARKVFSEYSSRRKTYMWSTRKQMPMIYSWSRTILDKVFAVDPLWARLNSGHKKSDLIFINYAMLSTQTFCVDVTEQMRDLMCDLDDPFLGENGQVSIGVVDLFNLDLDLVGDWNLEVTYTGHANSSKMLEARPFSVKYKSKNNEEVLFPPYGVSESLDRGMNVTRVLSAVDIDGKDRSLDAKKYAGLKGNFYEDLPEEVAKNFLPGKQAIVTLNRGERVAVSS